MKTTDRSSTRVLVSAAAAAVAVLCAQGLRAAEADKSLREGEMSGYLLVPHKKVPESFGGGYSMYVAAWPLQQRYPGNRFQSGLFGTWMFARFDGPKPQEKMYSDVEGGLGWWRDTQYATETPKFIMGGVQLNFAGWANGPGAGKGRDWSKPAGKYGIAQLSPWVLWPPDGLNLKQGTKGEWFGYGYLPLPLAQAKATTAGKNVPTGDQCWTLFLNTRNFKGPVAFFTPFFWSAPTMENPHLAGMFLDTRPAGPNRALQMETQFIPAAQATDGKGETYARIARTQFPCGPNGESKLVHQITSYDKKALWDEVKAWFEGGAPARGAIRAETMVVHEFTGGGGATWRIFPDGADKEARPPMDWKSLGNPIAPDPHTFGYRWDQKWVRPAGSGQGSLVALPDCYHLVTDGKNKPEWKPVAAAEVPEETGLAKWTYHPPSQKPLPPYTTPEDASSCWKKPGPVAGPFQARLGDGSVVTYFWYRFADQPALLNADLSEAEREAMQARAVKLHRAWTKDRDYLPPPAAGALAEIDPALVVTPPKGFEAGYVPIVTRQEAGTRRNDEL